MPFTCCCTHVADQATEHVVSVGPEDPGKATSKVAIGSEDVRTIEGKEDGEADAEFVEEFKSARTQTKRPPVMPIDEEEDEEEEEEEEQADPAAAAEVPGKRASQTKKDRNSLQSKFNPYHGLRKGLSVVESTGAAEQHYKIQDLLGAGGFGEVFKVERKTEKGKIFAMKNIPTGNVPDLARFDLELDISKKLNHPHIVKLHQTIKDDSTYFLVMDLLSGGDLFDAIVDNGGIKTAEAGKLLWQMLSGLVYLHHYKFVHRDIKPENYMLESKTGPKVMKLIDFGLAREYKVGTEGEFMTSKVGTRNYMGPEVWQQTTKGYTEKCDIWSIGVTLFVMLVANFPWNAKNDSTFLRQVTTKEPNYDTKQWKNHPQYMQDIVKRMLQKDYRKRPTAQEIIPAVEEKWPPPEQ